MEENWRPVVGFEGLYQVSNLGRVQSANRFSRIRGGGKRLIKPTPLKHWKSNSGYQMVQLSVENHATKHYVHRLVAMAFVANPDQLLEVNHINSDKEHNQDFNLEWVSRQGNEDHKVAAGRTRRGMANKQTKLTDQEIMEIRSLLIGGEAQASIARKFGVAQTTICRINTGNTWRAAITPQQIPSL